MADSPLLTVALLPTLTFLVALHLLRNRRNQMYRLDRIHSALSPPTPKASPRPVLLHTLLPPGEESQPAIRGVLLPGGRMAWKGPLEAGEALTEIVRVRQAPTAYLGPSSDRAVLQLGHTALQAGFDPRERLIVTTDAGGLESLLESRQLPPPWIVAEEPFDLEGLRRLHERFGCPILLVNPLFIPENYQVLS
jgi:hypothetical protein